MRGSAQIALLAVLLSVNPALLLAQQVGFSIGRLSPTPPGSRGSGLTISFHAEPRRTFHRPFLLTPGFYSYPFLSSDTPYQSIASGNVAPPSQFVIVQPPQEPVPEQKPAQLLLMERRGNRFVRIRSAEEEGDAQTARNESRASPISGKSASLFPRPEPQLTVLVFRDGRREETSSYTIADGVLYESADYWSTGSWTRSVNLALLDLPATRRENQLRGVRFLLPAGPHEVVVR